MHDHVCSRALAFCSIRASKELEIDKAFSFGIKSNLAITG